MRIIVTGGSGFIGAHLIKRLQKDGHKTINRDIVDGYDVAHPKTGFFAGKVDAIFHLACPIDPANYKKVATKTVDAAILGTINTLEYAKKHSAKYLFMSSSEVYGDASPPFVEDDPVQSNPVSERAFYDISKLAGEMITLLYHHYKSLNVRIVRPFNIYGPGMRGDDSRVIPSFMRRLKANKPVQITGKGTAIRTFCYIDDFIEGAMRSMFRPKTNGEIFNLGTTEAINIIELAKRLNARVERIGDRKAEQKNRFPNIEKAKKVLNWKPTTSLEKGLQLTWESYQ